MTTSYEEAKAVAHDGDDAAREALAGQPDLAPELLYYLAEDVVPAVRLAVASNSATPMHADLLLARDKDESVRTAVAGKLADLAATNSPQESTRLREMANEALMLLAKDQAVRIRQILSETLQEVADAPSELIRRLAWDVESIVATPVLKYSPVLDDKDLIEIIIAKPSDGAVSAVSGRDGVSGDVSDAIVESNDVEAIALLLGNESAQIREETLDRVIEEAEKIDIWHIPLAMRPKLPSKAAVKIARVVADDVLKRMQERKDLPDEITSAVRDVVLKRLGDGFAVRAEHHAGAESRTGGMHPDQSHVFDRAASEWAAGTLDEGTLLRELAHGDMEFAKAIIAVMADVPYRTVDQVRETRSIKGAVALSWRAGLSAKAAEVVQEKLAGIESRRVMRARGRGYPMSDNDMIQQIDFIRRL
ncbi:MAG: DUF2336 domain-containing protein [Rhodospirillales bacterium]|nr:DUF2336 domain-containing protein [Rhodospirillales bacterium]MBO6787931.1 DUF2336 domain-containing protein [Rhodospirillales bacterium]